MSAPSYEHTALVRFVRNVLPTAAAGRVASWEDVVRPATLLALTELCLSRAGRPPQVRRVTQVSAGSTQGKKKGLQAQLAGKTVAEAASVLVHVATEAGAVFDATSDAVRSELVAGQGLAFLWGLVELGFVRPLCAGCLPELLAAIRSELGAGNVETDAGKMAMMAYAKLKRKNAEEKRQQNDLRTATDFLSDLGLPRWTVDLAALAKASDKLLMLFAIFIFPILTGNARHSNGSAPVEAAAVVVKESDKGADAEQLKLEVQQLATERDELMAELDRTLTTAEESMRETQRFQSEMEEAKQKTQQDLEMWQNELKKALVAAEEALQELLEAQSEIDTLKDENSQLKGRIEEEKRPDEKHPEVVGLEELEIMSGIERQTEALRLAAESDLQVAVALTKDLERELQVRDEERSELLGRLEAEQQAVNVARTELGKALLCVEEGAQEIIASEACTERLIAARDEAVRNAQAAEAEMEKMRGDVAQARQFAADYEQLALERDEAIRFSETLKKQLNEAGQEMAAVLRSNSTLASEVVRLDEGASLREEIEALNSKNNALAAELLRSEKARVALMAELESAVQLGQEVGASVESDEVQRLREELRETRLVMEGLQTAAEEAVAESEKLAGIVGHRDSELAVLSDAMRLAKCPSPARTAAALHLARPLLGSSAPVSFVGESLLVTECVACAVMDTILVEKEWSAPAAAAARMFATPAAYITFVCNVAMWSIDNHSSCCSCLLRILNCESASVVAWLLWTRAKLYHGLRVLSRGSVTLPNARAANALVGLVFGKPFSANLSDVSVREGPVEIHKLSLMVAASLMKTGLPQNEPEKRIEPPPRREIVIVKDAATSFEEQRAARYAEIMRLRKHKPPVVEVVEEPVLKVVALDVPPIVANNIDLNDTAEIGMEESKEERLVYADDSVSQEEKRAVSFAAATPVVPVTVQPLAKPFDFSRWGMQFTSLCLSPVLENAASFPLSPETAAAVESFAASYCSFILNSQENASERVQRSFRKFVLNRLLLFLQKIRLTLASRRRFPIVSKTFTSTECPKVAEQDAQLSSAHLKQFCALVAKVMTS